MEWYATKQHNGVAANANFLHRFSKPRSQELLHELTELLVNKANEWSQRKKKEREKEPG